MQLSNIRTAYQLEAKVIVHPASLRYATRFAQDEKIVFTSRSGTHVIDPGSVRYCQSDSNYCSIILCDGRRILVSKTLKWVSSRLPQNEFIRVHASFLVRRKSIIELTQDQIRLDCGTYIPVSRGRRKGLRSLILKI